MTPTTSAARAPGVVVQYPLPAGPPPRIAVETRVAPPTRLFFIDFSMHTAKSADASSVLSPRIQLTPTGGGTLSATTLRASHEDGYLQGDSLAAVVTAALPAAHRLLEVNPFDFKVDRRCRLVFWLRGEFWRFSNVLDAMTLKQPSARYHSLRRLAWDADAQDFVDCTDGPCRIISAIAEIDDGVPIDLAGEPDTDGYNLNFDLLWVDGGALNVLPLTIDPEIDNRGS